jgi:hypothetical protein
MSERKIEYQRRTGLWNNRVEHCWHLRPYKDSWRRRVRTRNNSSGSQGERMDATRAAAVCTFLVLGREPHRAAL